MFVAVSAKPYFLAPLFVPLLAAGAVVTERWLGRGRRRLTGAWVLAGIAVGGLVALPIALPVLPPETLARTPIGEINPELGETHGWPRLRRPGRGRTRRAAGGRAPRSRWCSP